MAHDEWFQNYAPQWCACFCLQIPGGEPFYADIRSHSLLDAVCDIHALYKPGVIIHSWYQFTADGPVPKE